MFDQLSQTPAIEFASVDQVQNYQFELLQKQLAYVQKHSPYYQKLLAQEGIHPLDIKSLNDYRKIPLTSKDDLAHEQEKFLAIKKDQIREIVTTSGTTGAPLPFFLNAADLTRLGKNEALSFLRAGVKPGDRIQLLCTINKLFMAGLAYQLGAYQLGCSLMRVGPGSPSWQWEQIERFKPDFLVAVPSFAHQLMAYAGEHQIDYQKSSIRGIICIGQPIWEADLSWNKLASSILNKWDVKLISTYASTEMSTALTSCWHKPGVHFHPEMLYLEILDQKGNPVKSDEIGEVVVTPLGIQGMPLLRFQTGDLCQVIEEPCTCGRFTKRIGPILGRKSQQLKLNGTTLFPNMIFKHLEQLQIKQYAIEITSDEFGNDQVTLMLPMKFEMSQQAINDRLGAYLRVLIPINFIENELWQNLIQPSHKRKPQLVFDYRKSQNLI